MDEQIYRLLTIAFQTAADQVNDCFTDVRLVAVEIFQQFSAFYPEQFNNQTKAKFLKDCGVWLVRDGQ